MKTQDEKPALNESRGKETKPRFQIEKLEERIAPSHRGACRGGAYNSRGFGSCKH